LLIPVIPSTWEAEIRELQFKARSREKVSKTISQRTNQTWWQFSVIPATWEAEVGGLCFQGLTKPYLKNN
jgi:hypothetical protein